MCNTANPTFIPSPMLTPCELGPCPGMVYSIDLIPDRRETNKGNTQIVVCIDCFSKYVLLGALPNR